MTVEDTFIGAKAALAFDHAWRNTGAQVLGMEQVLAMETKMCEAIGTVQGEMIKEQTGIDEFDAITARQMLTNLIEEGYGILSDVIEGDPQRAGNKVGKCPVYESAQALGMDAEAIEASCRAGPIRFMDAIAKQLNPNLSYRLINFRSTADGCCEEAVVLTYTFSECPAPC
jgi:hypothetical protein